MNTMNMVQTHIEEAEPISLKRELQERFTTEQIVNATAQIIEHTYAELKMKLDHISVKGLLNDYGDAIHMAKVNDESVLLVGAD